MMLHKKCIPTNIMDQILDDIEQKSNIKLSSNNLNNLTKKEEILKQTSYKSDLNPYDVSVLKNIKNTDTNNVVLDKEQGSFDDSFWNNFLP